MTTNTRYDDCSGDSPDEPTRDRPDARDGDRPQTRAETTRAETTRADLVGSIDAGGLRADGEVVAGRRGFGRLLLAGAVGAVGLAGSSGSAAASEEWHREYYELVDEAIPIFEERFATSEAVEAMLATEAERDEFFDVLDERMDLDDAAVVSATVHAEPTVRPVPPEWFEIVREILADTWELLEDLGLGRCRPTWCPEPDLTLVPALTAHVRGPEGHAIVEIDPVGTSTGVFVDPEEWCWADPACDPVPPHWTADGWGTVGDGGRIFDGDPVPMPV